MGRHVVGIAATATYTSFLNTAFDVRTTESVLVVIKITSSSKKKGVFHLLVGTQMVSYLSVSM